MDYLAADITPGQRGWLARLRRRWWLIAVGLILGLAAGQHYLADTPKQYQSTADVSIVLDQAIVVQATLRQTAMDNELMWAQSPVVATQAASLLHWTAGVPALQSLVSAIIPANSQLISFTYTGTSPTGAQNGAEAFARAFATTRNGALAADHANSLKYLTAQQARTQAAIATNSTLETRGTPAQRAAAAGELTVLRNQANLLDSELNTLRLSTGPQVQLMDDATLPSSPTKPIVPLVWAAAALLGLVIGVLAAVLLARRDRRVRSLTDVRVWAGLPVIATVGRRGRRRLRPGLSSDRAVRSAADALRVRMWPAQRAWADAGTSVRPGIAAVMGTPRSAADAFAAVNVAASLARQDLPAVVVCTEEDSPVPGLLSAGGGPGLADLLRGTADLDAVVHGTAAHPKIAVIPPGPDISEVLREVPRTILEGHLRDLAARGAYVVVAAPPATVGVTGLEVARLADSVVLVAELGNSRVPDLQEAADELATSGSRLIGVLAVPRLVSTGGRSVFRARAQDPDASRRLAAQPG